MSLEALGRALNKAGVTNAERSKVSLWLTSGYPPLDNIVSGYYVGENAGFPVGRMVEIYAPSSSGKTALATELMASGQRAGGIAIFMDHERSYDSALGEKYGLNTTFPNFIYQKPETLEESFDLAEDLIVSIRESKSIPEEAPIVLVFDSLASMIPQSKWDKDAKDQKMNDNTALSVATAMKIPSLVQRCEKHNVLCLMLNQIRTKPGVIHGDPSYSPGGESKEFYSSVRLKLGKKIVRDEKTGEQRQVITISAVKNKVFKPFEKCEYELVFGNDSSLHFDVIGGTIKEAVACGALEQAGAYTTWTDGKKYHRRPLIEKITNEGLKDELFSLLKGRGLKERGSSLNNE